MLHREGSKIILVSTVLLVLINFLVDRFIPNQVAKDIIIAVSLVFLILVLQFFRNPKRQWHIEDGAIIAPCDGKVVVIEKTKENEFYKSDRIQISIFMSPLNVHVNRNPISGIVKFFKYHPGKFLVAWHPKSSEENERTTTVIESKNGHSVLFRQIAGAVAKRIKWYVKEGQAVKQTNEMGFIKFGSRVDVFLPLDAHISVKLNEKTKGGQTILAKFKI